MKPWHAMSKSVRGIPITRYIASWYNVGGTSRNRSIREWLQTLVVDEEHLTKEEVDTIVNCAITGKLELESSAKRFLAK